VPSLLALSDAMGTGWYAAEVKPGMTVVVGDGAVDLSGVIAAKEHGPLPSSCGRARPQQHHHHPVLSSGDLPHADLSPFGPAPCRPYCLPARCDVSLWAALAAALLGFFVITLDTLVVRHLPARADRRRPRGPDAGGVVGDEQRHHRGAARVLGTARRPDRPPHGRRRVRRPRPGRPTPAPRRDEPTAEPRNWSWGRT
jgi:hypothetical protein